MIVSATGSDYVCELGCGDQFAHIVVFHSAFRNVVNSIAATSAQRVRQYLDP